MHHSMAYQAGEVLGAFLVITILLGIPLLFIASLIVAIITRRKAWKITAIVSGIPTLLGMAALLVGIGVGFIRGYGRVLVNVPVPAVATTASRTPLITVTGQSIPYKISLPCSNAWKTLSKSHIYDQLRTNQQAAVGIIAEGIGVGNTRRLLAIAQKHIRARDANASFTQPRRIMIDAHRWSTFDVNATLKGIHLQYRFYVYGDSNCAIQIITWTGPMLFKRYTPLFDRIARTFVMPPGADPPSPPTAATTMPPAAPSP